MGPIWKAIYHPQPLVSFSSSLPVCVHVSLSAPNEQFPVHRFLLMSPIYVLTFSDHRPDSSSSSVVLRHQCDAQAYWNQTSEERVVIELLLCSKQLSLPVEDRCRRRRKATEKHLLFQRSRQELWERAQFDMRISFCKHTDQSVSGYWHPRVLRSHIFRDTEFESTAQGL